MQLNSTIPVRSEHSHVVMGSEVKVNLSGLDWSLVLQKLEAPRTYRRCHAEAQLVEALRYKSEGHGSDSRWCHWNFTLTQTFWLHFGPGIDSVSNSIDYQEYFLVVVKAAIA